MEGIANHCGERATSRLVQWEWDRDAKQIRDRHPA